MIENGKNDKQTMKKVREDIRYWIRRNFDLLTIIIALMAIMIGAFLGLLVFTVLLSLFPKLPDFLGLIIVPGSMLAMAYPVSWALELLTWI